jgi:hypothetical protein
MALPNFPSSPVNGGTYVVNGVTFQYRITAGRGEFVAQSGAGGTGGGIIYSNTLPTTLVPGVTYFDAEASELVFSYQDTDSTQYLAFPLLAGSGSLNFVGGSGGGSTITLSNAGGTTDGAGLVLGLISSNYPIRRIKAGAANNVTITESGNSVIVETLTPVNDGATGIGLVNTKTSTTQPFKRVFAGPGMTITDNGTYLTFSSSGGGSGTLGDTLTRLQTITAENNNVPVFTAAGATQFLTTASTRAMMGLSTTANTFPYFTGTSTASLATVTAFALNFLASSGVIAALTALKITSGSNANGAWLRIGTGDTSGIQICWHTISVAGAATQFGTTNFYYSASDTTWTFPQTFSGDVSVMGFPVGGNLSSIINGATGAPSTSAATFRQGAPGTTSAINASVFAIGVY